MRIFWLAGLTLALTGSLLGLDPTKTLTQYAHRIWGQEEGLSQPTVYSILQTHDGFLWLGTQDSLVRFDGSRFQQIDLHASHDLVHGLLEDEKRNLWIASVGDGLFEMHPDATISRFTTHEGLPSNSVFCLSPGHSGELWVCTNEGLSRWDGARFTTFTKANGLPSNRVRATCEGTNGTRWAITPDAGVAYGSGSHFHSLSSAGSQEMRYPSALACGTDGTVWVGTSAGLFAIDGRTMTVRPVRKGLPDGEISSLTIGPDRSLWIGTREGVSRYRDGSMHSYRVRDGLSHSTVLALYIDHEGSLWAGTKNGLDQFTNGNVTPYTPADGLSASDAGPVMEDHAGRLWVGTLGGGLNVFDGRQFRLTRTKDGLPSNTILSLAVDQRNDLWVGTDDGVARLHDGHVVRNYHPSDGLSDGRVNSLFVDAAGDLWAGTAKGLDRFSQGRFVHATSITGTDRSSITTMMDPGRARLFVSTEASDLFFLRADRTERRSLAGLSRPVDCSFNNLPRESLWLGTLGSGLLRWRQGVLIRVHVSDGLFDNSIYGMLPDGKSNLWIASSKGIFRVNIDELEDFADGKTPRINSIPFTTGQLRFECQAGVQPAVCRTRDGKLWFATTNGVVAVDPNHLGRDLLAPKIAITGTVVDGQRVDFRQKTVLWPSQRNFEFHYAGLSFVSPEKVTFRYILEGYTRQWTDAETRREAFFTNLSPGHYRFRVVAINADGTTSTEGDSVSFEVRPWLYQRASFWVGLVALVALLGGFWYRLRMERLRSSFRSVLAERSRIARELHDTLLQGLSGITMQLQALWTRLPSSKERQALAGIIEDAGRCSTEARHSLWGLRALGADKGGFADTVEKIARQAVSGSDVAYEIKIPSETTGVATEAEYQLIRIAQEAISNIMRHARARSFTVELASEREQLLFSIRDDGRGFESSAQNGAFGHFGLVGIRERAQSLGGELVINTAPGEGTTIQVRLPSNALQTSDHLLTYQNK